MLETKQHSCAVQFTALAHALFLVMALTQSIFAAGCMGGDDDDDTSSGCLDPLPLDCKPTFEPVTFDAIFDRVLLPSCGSSAFGSQCHGANGMQAGLALTDPDQAYDSLLSNANGEPRVIPGMPECSALIKRIEATDKSVRMPLNADPLSAGTRCAIRQWVAQGAER